MINDDVLIKYSLKRIREDNHPLRNNWVDYTRLLQSQILYITLGFPGIGRDDISITSSHNLQPGQRVFFDDNLDANCGRTDTDHAAILGKILEISQSGEARIIIEGIGQGLDLTRDPDRKLKWRDEIIINLYQYPTVLILNSVPRPDGGPVYYYFMKSTRDYRY